MLIIIHGWSDTSASFRTLGKRLKDEGVVSSVAHVILGDYVSLDDDVTFEDISEAMDLAWKKQSLPTAPRSCDVIVHSTGGLVIRHWMVTKHKDPAKNAIKRLVMLAPANFGSHLAHKGRSFIGRAVKGFKSERLFHTGARILDGLELASDFSWQLAQEDRFGSQTWYGPGGVLCTVLVGTAGNSGISAVANENGSDGVVRVSTAHLDPLYVGLDFATEPHEPVIRVKNPKGSTAFARIPEVNHGSITLKPKTAKGELIVGLIKDGLRVTDGTFEAHRAKLEAFSAQARAEQSGDRYTQSYQNTVVRLTDNYDYHIQDYFFEVFAKRIRPDGTDGAVDGRVTAMIQKEVFGKVHAFKRNQAYRSIMFNIDALRNGIIEKGLPLFVSVSAMPDVRKTNTVGYSTVGYNDIGSIRLDTRRLNTLFQPDRTVMIDMVIRREQTDRVFRFKSL